MQIILYFASILLTGALTGFLAAFAWRQRSVPGSRAYAGLALGECLLALAEILSMLSPTQAQALFWWQVRYLALAAVPVLWLVFALEYSGRKDWLSKRLLAGLFVVPVITQIMLWSNNLHGLWVKQEAGLHRNGPFWLAETGIRIPGLGFLAHSLYGSLLLLIGIALLLVAAWRMRRVYLGQALVVAGAASTAFVIAFIVTFNLMPRAEFNPFTPGIGLSVLLIALAALRFQFLKRAPAAEAGSKTRALETQAGRSLAVFLLIFLLMATGMAAVGYLSFQNYESRFRAQVESQLASIAELKVDELEAWRAERMGDAQAMRQNLIFAALAERYLKNPSDAPAQAQIQAWLDLLHSVYHYDRVFMLDTEGVERISSPAAPEPVAAHLAEDAAAVLSAGQVTLLDLHRDTADGPIHLALLVPILAGQEGKRPLGVLVLRIDPSVYLYPYLQQWPIPSASAETLLVRREGDYVLYLNELRFQADAALNLRIPLENAERPSVKAVLGQEGIVEGLDYRGAPVIGAVRAVPGSPWFLVARMDTAEVYAPLRERLWQTLVFFSALIAASGAGLILVWRQQRARYDREQVEAAQALLTSEAKYRQLIKGLNEGIWMIDEKAVTTFVNPRMAEMLGYTVEEMLGRRLFSFMDEQGVQIATLYLARRQQGIQEQHDFEFLRKDGAHIYASLEASPVTDLDGNYRGAIAGVIDITERKRAEEKLRESEARYKTLVENIPQKIFLKDSNYRYLSINDNYARDLGIRAEDVVGKVDYDFFPKELADKYRADDERIMKTGQIEELEEKYVQDGMDVWVNTIKTLARDEKDNIIGVFGIFQDITERKRQEAQILAAQAELQRLLAESDQSRRALLSVVEDQKKAEENLRQLNAELEQRVADRTALLARRNRELLTLYTISRATTESLDLEKTLDNAFEATCKALSIEAGGIYLLDPDGETMNLRVHRGHSDEFVQGIRRLAVGEGISGKAVVEKRPIVLDVSEYPTGRLSPLIVRGGFQTMASTPLLSAGQAVGALNLGTRRVRAFPPEELELLTAIGQQLGSAVRNAQLFEEVQRELADRKRAEAALRESQAKLEIANKEMESFAYSVSHDLRAPLRGIDGWSKALLEDCSAQLDDQARQYLDRVRAEAQRMGQLIDDLLQLSRVTRAEMRRSAVDLTALAHTVAARLTEAQPERQVEMVIQPGLTAHGDARLLDVLLTNLLGNAWKFTSARPLARIEFGLLPHPLPLSPGERGARGEGPVFFVRDNGVGFDMAYTEKLFGAFQRMHKASEFPGTGIGLATVQRIVHRHGGQVWAEAQVDQGATFYFTLSE